MNAGDSNNLRMFFQFPLSERTNCNQKCFAESGNCGNLSVSSIGTNELQLYFDSERASASCLSVSSIGTNELQPATDTEALAPSTSFSFLYRNERTATEPPPNSVPMSPCLSVSSIGTNELQHKSLFQRDNRAHHFQFPLSERTNCNASRFTKNAQNDAILNHFAPFLRLYSSYSCYSSPLSRTLTRNSIFAPNCPSFAKIPAP